jgi:putative flippase GtrA
LSDRTEKRDAARSRRFWGPALRRPARFAVVGAVGIGVQLAALQALVAIGCPYLWATGLAVEAAVLNNFVWHQRFTWSDRSGSCSAQTGARILRFHLSNGAISILGSLLLVRWLVGQLGVRVLVANLLTIAACSAGNFLASDRWVFLMPVQLAAKSDHTGCGRSPIQSSVRCAKGT